MGKNCSKLTERAPEQHQTSFYIALASVLLTLKRFHIFFGAFIVKFEQVNAR